MQHMVWCIKLLFKLFRKIQLYPWLDFGGLIVSEMDLFVFSWIPERERVCFGKLDFDLVI